MKINIGEQHTKVYTIKCIKHSTESTKPQLLGPLWQHDYERSPTIALFIAEGAASFYGDIQSVCTWEGVA